MTAQAADVFFAISEIYIFEIDGDKLIFSSGDGAKGLLEEGAVFKLMKEK